MADTTNSILMNWIGNTAYVVRDVVRTGGNNYRCITAHTSHATTFSNDSAYWTALEVTPNGTIYNGMFDWLVARTGNVGTGDREIVEFYAGRDPNTTSFLAVNNYITTSSGAELIIRPATSLDKHNGQWGNGYRMSSSTIYYPMSIGGGVGATRRVDGVAIRATSTATGNGTNAFRVGSNSTVYITNCLFISDCPDSDAGAAAFRMNGSDPGGGKKTAANCITISNGGVGMSTGNNSEAYIYNCVSIGATGINFSYPTSVTMKNSYFYGSTAAIADPNGYYPASITFVTCRHSDTGSWGSGTTGSTAYSTANFTNVTSGSEDFHLPTGSVFIDSGTDLSGDSTYSFSTDMVGVSRSSPWDIGPLEYVSGAILMGQQWT